MITFTHILHALITDGRGRTRNRFRMFLTGESTYVYVRQLLTGDVHDAAQVPRAVAVAEATRVVVEVCARCGRARRSAGGRCDGGGGLGAGGQARLSRTWAAFAPGIGKSELMVKVFFLTKCSAHYLDHPLQKRFTHPALRLNGSSRCLRGFVLFCAHQLDWAAARG